MFLGPYQSELSKANSEVLNECFLAAVDMQHKRVANKLVSRFISNMSNIHVYLIMYIYVRVWVRFLRNAALGE